MSQTVMEIFEEAARKFGPTSALQVKRDGSWQATTWAQYRDQTRLAARGMMSLGLQPGDGVAILGYNSPEWFIADLAAIYAGAVPAGIYTTNQPEQCHYIAEHAEASIAVVENQEQLAKFKSVRDRLPKLKAMVLIEGSDDDPQVHSWQELLEKANDTPEEELEARIRGQQNSDLCTLIYTSGTTGPPKAVMISHDNITWTARVTMAAVEPDDGTVSISYLPLSHIAEQMLSLHGPMYYGGCVYFAESIEKLAENLSEVRPELFFGVPRVWEKIQAKVAAAGKQNTGLKKKIAAWARGVGLRGGYAEQAGRPKPLLYGLADKLVFQVAKERMGLDRSRLNITSAAPISKDTLEFFLSLGIPLFEIYGMSECTGPGTISLPGKYKTGKTGTALSGTEVKIADDGEVMLRGPHVFMGYFKNDEATKDTLEGDGWLHSGDVGTLDDAGFLQITDRKKELIITAGGENIAPALIEAQLKGIPCVGQAAVIGDRRKYLSALLSLDPESWEDEARAAGSPAKDVPSLAKCEAFHAYIQKQVDAVNADLPRVQNIRKWRIVDGEFSIEGGELTPTMKLKRRIINEKYDVEIEGLYA